MNKPKTITIKFLVDKLETNSVSFDFRQEIDPSLFIHAVAEVLTTGKRSPTIRDENKIKMRDELIVDLYEIIDELKSENNRLAMSRQYE